MAQNTGKASISERFYAAGQELTTSGSDIAEVLNQTLNRFIGLPFRAGPGSAVDSQGQRTGTFATLVRKMTSKHQNAFGVEVPADATACVIDVSQTLDLDGFRAAYGRIADAKTLKKTSIQPTSSVAQTNITLGIIFALEASVPLEVIAEEVDRLNGKTASAQWADMVVILSQGIINYAVQFPGEGVSGDLLPPAEGALALYTPPTYVIMVLRPAGQHSFNKMCSYLIAHLSIFSPGAKLPHFQDVMEGTPSMAMTLSGYQYNLRGVLLPVPRQFYNDRYLPPLPFRIEDGQGNLLSTVQFLPWQDGGVVLLKGKLPLDGLLIFLGGEALRRSGVVKRNDLQISYVLPITRADFHQMLQRIQRQSNMVVKNDPTQFVVQKFADEGTSSPFVARVFVGMLHLRDQVFSGGVKQNEFDEAFNFVLTELLNARATVQEIVRTVGGHAQKVSQGEAARMHGHSIHIDESIDRQLAKQVEDFLNGAVRALKHGMQNLTKTLQADIGFLFQRSAAFENGVAALGKLDPLLAAYLKQARLWSEPLLDRRNAIEHEGWKLPKVKYSNCGGTIHAEEPEIAGQKVTEFVKVMLDRLMCFAEEVTAHCLQSLLPESISITEIPLSQRESEMPSRFRVTLVSGGMPVWRILYHASPFEEN